MDFAELAHEVAAASPPRRELTLEQERAVVADPKLLLAADKQAFTLLVGMRSWLFAPFRALLRGPA